MDFTYFNDYCVSTGLGILVIDKTGGELYQSPQDDGLNMLERLLDEVCKDKQQCLVAFLYNCMQAFHFGGRYIFYSPRGLCYLACPLTSGGEMTGGIIAGPLLMTDYDEYLEMDIGMKYPSSFVQLESLVPLIRSVPQKTPAEVRSLMELLFSVTQYFCIAEEDAHRSENGDIRLQAHISEYIQQVKREADTGYYPLEKETALLAAMSRGDFSRARGLLNEILGHVLFQSGSNLEMIRSRVVELMVLLSRAAVRGGADAQAIFGLNYGYLQEIDSLRSFEELTKWLSDIMNRFSQHVFEFADAKHVDVIYRAIAYMQQNYMKKLSLEQVAAGVYLSAPYLSKIFKQGTGYNFNNYLNLLRIEESKRLLRDPSIPLVDISSMVGYEDQSYFTKVFKKLEGISPGKYRQMMLN